jgi:hypothetical protein
MIVKALIKKAIIGVGIFLFSFFIFELLAVRNYNSDMNFQGHPVAMEIIQAAWDEPSVVIENFLTIPIVFSIITTFFCEYILLLIRLYKKNKVIIANILVGITLIIGVFILHIYLLWNL